MFSSKSTLIWVIIVLILCWFAFFIIDQRFLYIILWELVLLLLIIKYLLYRINCKEINKKSWTEHKNVTERKDCLDDLIEENS